jgi:two-component system, NarL family, sensor histidine kinase UhpB
VSRRRYRPLVWRVFAMNAAVLVAAGVVAVVVLSPGSVSETVVSRELGIVAVGLLAMLVVNRLALARAFAPLERVVAAMRRADPLVPGRRLDVPARASEASDLAQAFNDMLARLEDERRDSTRRALGAQEAERRRIARELHDEIGQELTALLLQVTTARRVAGPSVQPVLTEVHGLARGALDDVRRVARDLRPEALDDLGLVSALAALGERLRHQAGLEVEQRVPTTLPALSDDQELVLYRIAQEALTNVIRHAGAEQAELTLRSDDGEVVLEVRDRGAGFDPDGVQATGLQGMRERALLIGARLDIDSRPGDGTSVRLALRP